MTWQPGPSSVRKSSSKRSLIFLIWCWLGIPSLASSSRSWLFAVRCGGWFSSTLSCHALVRASWTRCKLSQICSTRRCSRPRPRSGRTKQLQPAFYFTIARPKSCVMRSAAFARSRACWGEKSRRWTLGRTCPAATSSVATTGQPRQLGHVELLVSDWTSSRLRFLADTALCSHALGIWLTYSTGVRDPVSQSIVRRVFDGPEESSQARTAPGESDHRGHLQAGPEEPAVAACSPHHEGDGKGGGRRVREGGG